MFKSFSQSRGRSLFRHLFGHWSLLYFGRLAGEPGLHRLPAHRGMYRLAQRDSGRWII